MFFKTRAGKKKSLTSPVDLIPFNGQSLREKVNVAPKTIVTENKPISIPAPTVVAEVKTATTVSANGNLNTNSFSIKGLLKKEEEKAEQYLQGDNLPQQPYTFDHIKMLWRRHAFEVKEKGLETFYNALIKRDPILKADHMYHLIVDNQIQVDYITPHLEEMVSFLRKEVKNYSIQVIIELNDQPEVDVKFLTGKDKFAALARKNPNLHTLKNTFNLDIEF
jgi:hypothetical protein